MDTRFVRAEKVKYPLYKRGLSLRFWIKVLCSRKRDLRELIASVFQVEKSHISLFHSESEAIIQILIYYKILNNINRVYIPAFSCTELVDAVLSAGCMPVLYEIDNDLNPVKDVLYSLEGKQNIILILPSLFGLNKFDKELYNYLKKQEYIIVFDEAQTFPMSPRVFGECKKNWYSVISFGPSKPTASVGGGALIAHFSSGIFELEIKENEAKYINDLKRELKEIIFNNLCRNNLFSKYIKGKIITKKIYNSLEILQENSISKEYTVVSISRFQEKCAYVRIIDYKKWSDDKTILLLKEKLIRLFYEKLGSNTIKLIKSSIANQSVFAFYITKEKRYEFAVKLAQIGIQTTLYYLPIPLIKRYQNKYIDAISKCEYTNSKEIIDSILILPCNLDYNAKDIKEMIQEIKGVLK